MSDPTVLPLTSDAANADRDDKKNKDAMNDTKNVDIQKSVQNVVVGGNCPRACYALLDGIHEDPESGKQERVTIPITQLPAILGRSHDTKDQHFFGLGKKKALSRKHCTIYYRDAEGGRVEWNDKAKRLEYEANAEKEFAKENLKPNRNNKGENDAENQTGDLPPRGFFVIECIGKNRILVDKERVEQGDSIVLQSGSAVRISSYMLYFLLPTDAKPEQHMIPPPISDHSGGNSVTSANQKKRKGSMNMMAPPPVPSLAGSAAAAASKKQKSSMGPNFQNELDAMPVDTLIEMMDQAVQEGLWERRHQLIGSTIAVHAVRSAGESPELQKIASRGGVARSEIMGWIEGSDKYGNWVKQMLQKMEPRSYQASITKSLLKAGFARTSGAGRYVKWELPADIKITESRDTGEGGDPGDFDSDDEPLSKTKKSAERKEKDIEGKKKGSEWINNEDAGNNDYEEEGEDLEGDHEEGITGAGIENQEDKVGPDKNKTAQESNDEDDNEEEEDGDDDDDANDNPMDTTAGREGDSEDESKD